MEVSQSDAQALSSAAPSPFQLKKILAPVDFSPASEQALRYAVSFAKQFQAALTLVHVVQVNYGVGELGMVDVPMLETQIRENASKRLDALAQDEIPRKFSVETAVLTGRPATEIVRLAREKDVDLIILATHGHTGLKHVFLGSTAENVVRHAPCPVLTVREQEREFLK